MTVAELVARLVDVEPESVVVFLESYADADESDEIHEVIVPSDPWTFEVEQCVGSGYEIRYPGPPRSYDDNYHQDLIQKRERVVVLSNGPTNLKFYGVV